MKKLLFIFAATLCLAACEKNAEIESTTEAVFVDLGLPSGTKWKSANEKNPKDGGRYFNYYDAEAYFGNSLPTKKQLEELKNRCQWSWNGNGYTITGPNGESIVLPAAGFRYPYGGNVDYVGKIGNYWSRTMNDNTALIWPWAFDFDANEVNIYSYEQNNWFTVRLVQ